jgi:hypothetical protein
MKSLNYDHSTGKTIKRDLTLDEIAVLETLAADIETKEKERAAARTALLQRLSITEDEAKLLLS